jgi:epoxyqueuosine reductase
MTDVQPRRPLPAKLADHPSVRTVLARRESDGEAVIGRPAPVLDAAWLRELCLAAGADDAAAVSLDHPDLADERPSRSPPDSGPWVSTAT